MSIADFIAVVSFGLTCFSIGYAFGKDINKTQKEPRLSSRLFLHLGEIIYFSISAMSFFCSRASRSSMISFCHSSGRSTMYSASVFRRVLVIFP